MFSENFAHEIHERKLKFILYKTDIKQNSFLIFVYFVCFVGKHILNSRREKIPKK